MTVPFPRLWAGERRRATVLLLAAAVTGGIAAANALVGVSLALVPLCLLALVWVLARGETRLAPALLLTVFLAGWLPSLITVGGFNLKLHEVVLPLVLAAAVVHPDLAQSTPWLKRCFWLSLVLWSTALVWTVLQSPDLKLALGHVALLGLNLVQLLLFLALVADRESTFRNSVLALAAATIAAQVWTALMMAGAEAGLAGFQQFVLFEHLPVVQGASVTNQEVARNTLGVIIGSFSGALMATCAGLTLSPLWRPKAVFYAGGVAGALGVVLGIARGPLVAVAAGALVYTLALLRRGRIATLGRLLLTYAACGIAAYAMSGLLEARQTPVRAAFAGKAVQLVTAEEYQRGTAGVRLRAWEHMLDDVIRNPLVGQGYDTYRKYFPPANVSSENFPMEILHTTGLIGFAAYALLLGTAWVRAWSFSVSHSASTLAGAAVLPLLAGHFGLTVASATNPSAGGAIYWVLLALLVVATELARRGDTAPATPQTPARTA